MATNNDTGDTIEIDGVDIRITRYVAFGAEGGPFFFDNKVDAEATGLPVFPELATVYVTE